MVNDVRVRRIIGKAVTIDFFESGVIEIVFHAETRAAIQEWRDLSVEIMDDPMHDVEYFNRFLLIFCHLDDYPSLQSFKHYSDQVAAHPRASMQQYAGIIIDTSHPLISAVRIMTRVAPRNRSLRIFNCTEYDEARAWLERGG